MAIQTKAKWAQLKVGILAIVAMVILAVLIFLITGNTNFFESKVTVLHLHERRRRSDRRRSRQS